MIMRVPVFSDVSVSNVPLTKGLNHFAVSVLLTQIVLDSGQWTLDTDRDNLVFGSDRTPNKSSEPLFACTDTNCPGHTDKKSHISQLLPFF